MSTTFHIHGAAILAMAEFTGTFRPELETIKAEVTATTITLIATDTHCLGILHLDTASRAQTIEGSVESLGHRTACLLSAGEVKALVGTNKQSKLVTVCIEDDGTVTLANPALQMQCVSALTADRADAFPTWRRVVPTEIRVGVGMQCDLDGALLAKFTACAKRLKTGTHLAFGFTGGPLAPVAVRITSIPEFYGVLMPMQADASMSGERFVPAWMQAPAAPVPATPVPVVETETALDTASVPAETAPDTLDNPLDTLPPASPQHPELIAAALRWLQDDAATESIAPGWGRLLLAQIAQQLDDGYHGYERYPEHVTYGDIAVMLRHPEVSIAAAALSKEDYLQQSQHCGTRQRLSEHYEMACAMASGQTSPFAPALS